MKLILGKFKIVEQLTRLEVADMHTKNRTISHNSVFHRRGAFGPRPKAVRHCDGILLDD